MILSGHQEWVKIAEHPNEIPFNEAGMAEMMGKGKKICIIKKADSIQACAATCPHAGGHLSKGYLDGLGNLVCPLHRYKFNLSNGRNVTGEGYYLKVYEVEQREDGLFVRI